MKIDILTVFPEMFKGPFSESILKRAQEKEIIKIKIHNLRDWATDKRRSVDDSPYGGGPGMIMRVDIIDRAIQSLTTHNSQLTTKIILLDAAGKVYTQQKAQKLSKVEHLILIAGHYEGIDHRVHEHVVDEVISIGKYVLTGGEIPVMVIVDSIVRLLPGVLGNPESLIEESFSQSPNTKYEILNTKIESPQYTRPSIYKGWKVPKVLVSGNHAEIIEWRTAHSQ